jgi:ankyrin repeat protein
MKSEEQSLLAAAALDNDHARIAELLEAGESPDTQVPGFGPLVIYAAKQGNLAMVRQIEACGGALDAADENGETALFTAAREGLYEIVRHLAGAGADPLRCNGAGKDPLRVARDAALELGNTFNADETISPEELENRFSNFGRVAHILTEAQEEARRNKTVSSCHQGTEGILKVGRPLKFRTPDIA